MTARRGRREHYSKRQHELGERKPPRAFDGSPDQWAALEAELGPRYGDGIVAGGRRHRVTGLYEPSPGERLVCYAVGLDVATVPLDTLSWDEAAAVWRTDATPTAGTPGQTTAFT